MCMRWGEEGWEEGGEEQHHNGHTPGRRSYDIQKGVFNNMQCYNLILHLENQSNQVYKIQKVNVLVW